MSSLKKTLCTVLCLFVFLALSPALAGCKVEKKEGPFEKAGEQIDKDVKKLGEKVEDAGENIQDAAKGK